MVQTKAYGMVRDYPKCLCRWKPLWEIGVGWDVSFCFSKRVSFYPVIIREAYVKRLITAHHSSLLYNFLFEFSCFLNEL